VPPPKAGKPMVLKSSSLVKGLQRRPQPPGAGTKRKADGEWERGKISASCGAVLTCPHAVACM
jgi:hypothetical protein